LTFSEFIGYDARMVAKARSHAHSEELLSLSTGFRLVAEASGRAADHCAALRVREAEDDCKLRRKPLESLKTESEIARRTGHKWRNRECREAEERLNR
jgi:hypothetical protein